MKKLILSGIILASLSPHAPTWAQQGSDLEWCNQFVSGVNKEEAEKIAARMKEAGAEVTID